ncbi:MAG: 1-acyl-sn-glycerol-3-phosphate acyltransferase [Flavobacteriales bacterium]|nr:1-acyl-sn-glycerol-3-phosphate acyltransferase [Flavobacteriales bacterium]
MKWILFLPRLVWKVWFLIYMLFSTIVLFPFIFVFIVVLKNYSLTFNTIYKIWAWSICLAIGIIPRIKGKDKLPKCESYILVANHSSQLDIVVPYTRINKYFAFLAKEELKKAPLFKTNFRGMNVTVNRKDMVSGAGALRECAEKLKEGVNLLIFPEGTRSKTAPVMRSFKAGLFKLAVENEVPLVPMVFLDNYKRLEGGDTWFGKCGPGQSRMIILDPINTKGMKKKDIPILMEKTYKVMEDCLKAHIKSFS